MAIVRALNLGSLNLKVSPLLQKNGDMIRMVNVDTETVGAKKKRPGYIKYLGTPDNDQVNSLFTWQQNDGTTFWNYRASGSSVYYSTQGTGPWTICGNGTITDGNRVGWAVLEDTLIMGDGGSATRHSTDGTSFTNTTEAPKAEFFIEYQNRIWAGGTATTLFWSNVGTATDWTNDSSSITIPGPGKINSVFKNNDRIVISKNSNKLFRFDAFNLVDLSTKQGPSSPYSIAEVENFMFWLNRDGVLGYGGGRPELISAPIQKQIYNDSGSAILGANFDTAAGETYRHNYYLSVGTITDDLTDETIDNAILKYDFQLDEWSNYSYGTAPTTWNTYKDESGDEQLIFGDSGGQCYQVPGTAQNDDGAPISAVMEFVIHGGMAETTKKWNWIWAFFSPGTQAKVQVATGDTFTKGKKKWVDIGDASDGVFEQRLPADFQSKLLFLKITESSRATRFNFYGFAYDADPIERL